ncbi:pyridoxamine 5'-phosphate oxidase family protein [Vagococcus elongatus]|uniref:Pyridoxamine 5-phosphate oxidase n=1 Tax=Vagococcus elongatus TaxID=180344 RepID=A0A430B1W4_9ENTE|nr:pyridoxamine 5'-phosphate oxidase family protein [Vagococcus elongatus]RSU14323.1 pyridoxamine 5-phosphate oxidase [Vagococcus elongatus]
MEFSLAMEQCFHKLGKKKIMALGSSLDDKVSVRNVSCIIHDKKIYFKTDKNFPKTKQLLENPNVAICHWGVQIEGVALNHGLVVLEENKFFQELYEQHWKNSYTAYPHEKTEILIEVVPQFIEIWDQDENNHGFQVLIDVGNKTAEKCLYD